MKNYRKIFSIKSLVLFCSLLLTVIGGVYFCNNVPDAQKFEKNNTSETNGLELQKQEMFRLVKDTLRLALEGKGYVVPKAEDYKISSYSPTGVFVTLEKGGKLLGCKGNIRTNKPFIETLSQAAYDAGFSDNRFSGITKEDFNSEDFEISISLLGSYQKINFKNEEQLIAKLEPFKYAVRIKSKNGKQQAFFLSSVWSKYPTSKRFLKQLKRKGKIDIPITPNKFMVEFIDMQIIQEDKNKKQKHYKHIDDGIKAFKNLINEDGRIQYEIDFLSPGLENAQNRNVREMGSAYTLAYIAYKTKDKDLLLLIKKILDRTEQNLLKGSDNQYYIADELSQRKIGAVSLGLLTVLFYEKQTDVKQYQELREKLVSTLKHNFMDNKGFRLNPESENTNPLYDGESYLAVAIYTDMFPENKEIASLMKKIDNVMLLKYQNNNDVLFFHWGAQAVSQRYLTTKYTKFLDFLRQMYMLNDKNPMWLGFSSCSHLEGYGDMATAFYQSGDDVFYQSIKNRIEKQINIPYYIQLKSNILPDKSKIHISKEKYIGLFLNNPYMSVTRNDITAHCVSALLKTAPHI